MQKSFIPSWGSSGTFTGIRRSEMNIQKTLNKLTKVLYSFCELGSVI